MASGRSWHYSTTPVINSELLTFAVESDCRGELQGTTVMVILMTIVDERAKGTGAGRTRPVGVLPGQYLMMAHSKAHYCGDPPSWSPAPLRRHSRLGARAGSSCSGMKLLLTRPSAFVTGLHRRYLLRSLSKQLDRPVYPHLAVETSGPHTSSRPTRFLCAAPSYWIGLTPRATVLGTCPFPDKPGRCYVMMMSRFGVSVRRTTNSAAVTHGHAPVSTYQSDCASARA